MAVSSRWDSPSLAPAQMERIRATSCGKHTWCHSATGFYREPKAAPKKSLESLVWVQHCHKHWEWQPYHLYIIFMVMTGGWCKWHCFFLTLTAFWASILSQSPDWVGWIPVVLYQVGLPLVPSIDGIIDVWTVEHGSMPMCMSMWILRVFVMIWLECSVLYYR